MKLNPNIFKAYDIRAKYPEEINADTAYRVGEAITIFLKKKYKKENPTIVTGRDVRTSSPELHKALVKGMITQGAHVQDIGIVTTPFFYYLVDTGKTDGGVMVTASHNPVEYNGFKIRGRGVVPISYGKGLEKIQRIASQKISPAKISGEVTHVADHSEAYLHFLTHGITINTLKTVIDAAGGSTVFLLPKLLNMFPDIVYKPLFFQADGSFKKHSPNPLNADAQHSVKKELVKGGYRFGAIFDGDGDRVLFFDEKGVMIQPEHAGALFAADDLRINPNASIVCTVDTSRAAREYIIEHGGKIKMSKVGYTNVSDAMKKSDALVGMETSGHFYFKKLSYRDSALLAWLRMASVVSHSATPLSHILASLRKYISSGHLNMPVKDKQKIIQRLAKKYAKEGKVTTLDGVTVEFPDWWFNLRPSNTEPVVRLLIEAKTQHLLDEKKKELEQFMWWR